MKKKAYSKIAAIYLLVVGVVMLAVVAMVGIASIQVVLKNVEVQSGDPVGFVLETGIPSLLFLVAGILGLKRKAPKVRILLGCACGIYGITSIFDAGSDVGTILIQALAVIASVVYVYGAWKEK